LENYDSDIQKTEGNIKDLLNRLENEEGKLITIRESLKGMHLIYFREN
jgi:hypothetical protein